MSKGDNLGARQLASVARGVGFLASLGLVAAGLGLGAAVMGEAPAPRRPVPHPVAAAPDLAPAALLAALDRGRAP